MRFFILILILLWGINLQADEGESVPNYRIIGYYAGWAVERDYFVTDIPADKLTHINYAFANISEDGEIMIGDEWTDTQFPYPDDPEDADLKGNFRQLQLLKEANPHLQTLISVGGWSWSDRGIYR
jgi:chitinase